MLGCMTGHVGDAQVARAASELHERYRVAFEERGGHLRVGTLKAGNLRSRTKSLELYAEVEWAGSRIYDHVHVQIAERPWFSRRWQKVRSLREALDQIEAKLAEWLRENA
jgi:hypothetical protein